MMAASDLLERVREALAPYDTREVRMFGGVSFMIDEQLVAAVRRNQELLLRIDPADRERLLAEPGARPAVMGSNRAMGPSWITVAPDALSGEGLDRWLARALDHHRSEAG